MKAFIDSVDALPILIKVILAIPALDISGVSTVSYPHSTATILPLL